MGCGISRAERSRRQTLRYNKRRLLKAIKKTASRGLSQYHVKWKGGQPPTPGLKDWLEQDGYSVTETYEKKKYYWVISWGADPTQTFFNKFPP